MAAWRQAMELAIGEEDVAALSVIARSRSEPARRVERARMLLAYQENPSFLRWHRLRGCTIRLSNAVLNGRWLMVRSRRSTICRGRVVSRQSRRRPKPGW